MGFLFIIAFLFCIQDFPNTVNTSTGFPIMQIMVDCVGKVGAIVMMVMLIIACWQCGFASVAANSRMIYAFSRDGAMPGSQYWHKIDTKRQVKKKMQIDWQSVTFNMFFFLRLLSMRFGYLYLSLLSWVYLLWVTQPPSQLLPRLPLLVFISRTRFLSLPRL